jgi:hypothetical protein
VPLVAPTPHGEGWRAAFLAHDPAGRGGTALLTGVATAPDGTIEIVQAIAGPGDPAGAVTCGGSGASTAGERDAHATCAPPEPSDREADDELCSVPGLVASEPATDPSAGGEASCAVPPGAVPPVDPEAVADGSSFCAVPGLEEDEAQRAPSELVETVEPGPCSAPVEVRDWVRYRRR